MATPTVSRRHLLATLEAINRFGARPDGGQDRVHGSEADRAAREWVAGRIEELGLEPRPDPTGNVIGVPGGAGRFILLGSHTDTVPGGGRLDGALGVAAALEAVRALREAGHPAAGRIGVADFADEEGVTGDGLTGSRTFIRSGEAQRVAAYLELHIEQGGRLEQAGLRLGVVEGIVGIDRWEVRFRGQANHAGTTPLELRRDAGRAAFRLGLEVWPAIRAIDSAMVGNVGTMRLLPGAPNVVPGEAVVTVEFRSIVAAHLHAAAERLLEIAAAAAAAEGCEAEVLPVGSVPPVGMAPEVVRALQEVCSASGQGWTTLSSGAGHDAGMLARVAPAAMLFVPSRDGISHSPAEWTDPDDLVLGTQVLLETAVALSARLPA